MSRRLDIDKIKTCSIDGRRSKVSLKDFSRPFDPRGGISEFFQSLPNILAGQNIHIIIEAVLRAYREKRGIIWAMGAHVIKCGLSPIVIDLIKRGCITAIALNGAGLIHDFEIALFGKTSEDVSEALKEGQFGMAKETGELLKDEYN